MKQIFRMLALFALWHCTVRAYAGNYNVKKGGTIKVNCTATAPAGGWITHAFFSFVNPEDQEYLGLSYTSSDMQATFYGLKIRSNIKIEVTYAYSFRGSYDNNIHVGHGTYYDYISVTGAPNATGLDFREGGKINMRPGTSKTLHVDLKPVGADGYVTWGFINGLGSPFKFDLTIADDGLSAVVTAKRAGSAYLLAMIDEDQKKSDVIEIVCSEDAEVEVPTALALSPSELTVHTGETATLSPAFTPSSAWADLKWSSDRPSIATVDENGTVTGISPGTATIKAATADGSLSAESKVTVKQKFLYFSLPYSATVNLGFTYTVNPDIQPLNSTDDLKWSSSDTSVATVSATGVITAKKEGSCTITATSKLLDRSESMSLMVTRPATTVMDHRNLRQRIQAVKSLITRTVIMK